MKRIQLESNEFIQLELQNGQERAFDYIFRKYYKALCAQANAYVNDLDKAQSLVQSCFVKLWENRDELDKIKKLSPYLSFMVRNRCIDYLRKTKTFEQVHEVYDVCDTDIHTEDTILFREFEERLIVALTALPERCRVAFEYSRFQELSYKEIAEKMDISNKGVEALISRSLKILRKDLKEYLPIFILLYKLTRL